MRCNWRSYYCNESFCEGGVFWPDQCRPRRHERSARPCAVLLAEYPDYMTFLPAQIQQLGLLVKVIWLGPHTDHVVREFLDKEDRLEQVISPFFFTLFVIVVVVVVSWYSSFVCVCNQQGPIFVDWPPANRPEMAADWHVRCRSTAIRSLRRKRFPVISFLLKEKRLGCLPRKKTNEPRWKKLRVRKD